jgi:hypothetical protein
MLRIQVFTHFLIHVLGIHDDHPSLDADHLRRASEKKIC